MYMYVHVTFKYINHTPPQFHCSDSLFPLSVTPLTLYTHFTGKYRSISRRASVSLLTTRALISRATREQFRTCSVDDRG